MSRVIGRPEATMVIRTDGEIRAWTWRGRLHTAASELAAWTDTEGRQWHRMEDTGRVGFLLGRGENGWRAMPWPPAPELYAIPEPVRSEPAAPAGPRRRKVQ